MAFLERASAPDRIGKPVQVRTRLAGIALVLVSAVIFVALALRILNYEMRKDEQLYVPPVRLLDTSTLYTDFFYNHTPGSAWLFHAIGRLTGTDHLLLAGRLGVLLGWIAMIAVIGGLSYVLTRSRLASWCIVVLSLANELFLTQPGMTATNNFLPLPLSLLGLGLFVLAIRDDRASSGLAFGSGFFLGLAVVFKVSAVAFVLPVALAAFLLPRALALGERLRRVVLPVAIGGVIGGLPVLYYVATQPARFLAHVVGYHTGPHASYMRMPGIADDGAAISLAAKLLMAHDIWLSAGVAVALVVLVALLLAVLRRDARTDVAPRLALRDPALFVLGAALCGILFAFIPTPGFPQYFALPLICLPLALALLYGGLAPSRQRSFDTVLLAAAVVALAVITPRLGQFLPRAANPERWTVARVHDDGRAIAARLADAGVSGKVATLAPIYPLEGGLPVYPELATGPFAYRTGDMTPPGLASQYRMTSPQTVGALLAADPPAALLLGFDEVLEQPLRAYAEANGYRAVEDIGIRDRYGSAVLYLRQAAPAP
jgi:hypothetical protein